MSSTYEPNKSRDSDTANKVIDLQQRQALQAGAPNERFAEIIK